MKLVLLPFLIILFDHFSSGVCKSNSSRPDIVNIGAIFTLNSTIGKVANVAIDAAVKDVNSNSIVLRGTELVMHKLDFNCNGYIDIVEALQFMETDIVAIIGPQSSVVAHVITHLANELQKPLLSFAATDPTLSSLQYPFFVRTSQSDAFQMAAIAELVDYFQWREVIVIFIDDDYGRNVVASLKEMLMERRCKISYKAALPSEANRTEISDLLIKIARMESQIIVLHANPDSGLKVFSVAHYLGMVTNGYVWISTDWLSSLLDSFLPLDSDTMDTLQGVLSLRQHTADTQRKRNLVSKWSKFTDNDKAGYLRLNSYGLYAYDAVWMVAHALDAFFDDGGNINFLNDSELQDSEGESLNLKAMNVFSEGNLLLKNIRRTAFEGVTGSLQFDHDGNLMHPSYDILNIVGTGSRIIGYWSNYSGLSPESPESLYLKPPNNSRINKKLYEVFWPGHTTTKPRGWVCIDKGQELRIGVPYRASYPEFISKDADSETMKGYCLDVFIAAIGLLPYPVPYRFIAFGNGHENPNYTELVQKVATKEFDAAVGDITITTDRTKIVDFTQPYVESGLVILASVKEHDSSAWALIKPFSWELWCVTVAFFIIIGGVIWTLEHRINDEFRGPPNRQLITTFFFTISTLFSVQRENVVSNSGRFVILMWMVVVLIIQSSYTASLTSILTLRQLKSPITGFDTLKNGKDPIGYQVGSFAEKYLTEELRLPSSRLKVLHNPDEYARFLELGPSKGVMAVVDERPYVELFISTKCKFAIVDSELTRRGWGFAFPRDSPLAIDISTAILKLSENGDMQRIHDKWLARNSCRFENIQLEPNRLQLHSFWVVFALCGVACFLALLTFFIKVTSQFLRYANSEETENVSSFRITQLQSSTMNDTEIESETPAPIN